MKVKGTLAAKSIGLGILDLYDILIGTLKKYAFIHGLELEILDVVSTGQFERTVLFTLEGSEQAIAAFTTDINKDAS